MNHKTEIIFSSVFLVLISLALSQTASASTFTVRKVKGKQAIVDYTGPTLKAGETYHIDNGQNADSSGSRGHFVSIREFEMSQVTQSVSSLSNKTTKISLMGSYGWNHQNFEYGPLFGFGSIDAGNGAATTFTLGGIFDYNFQPNISGQSSIWGVGTELTYSKTSNPGSSEAPTTMDGYLSGFWKWFLLGNSTCLRLDLGYKYQKISGGTEVTLNGVMAKGSFGIYF